MSFQHYPEFHRKILQDKKLCIPKKYVKKYWKGILNPIFLRFPNGVQQEIFWVESNGDILFQKNWNPFSKSIKCGYLLSFKYIGGSYFKVKIFGVNALEINYSNIKSVSEEVIEVSDESEDESEDESGDESEDECEIAKQPQRTRSVKRKIYMDLDSTQQKFSGVNNNNPNPKKTFKIVVRSAYPYIPENVLSSYGIGECHGKFAELNVDGESWSVKLYYYNSRHGNRFYKGWKIFKKDCQLKIGDTCFLELIDEKKLVFKVSIKRST